MTPTKAKEGVAETRLWNDKVLVSMCDGFIKNSQIKIPKPQETSSCHRKKIYKISSDSVERCKKGCGDKVSDGR